MSQVFLSMSLLIVIPFPNQENPHKTINSCIGRIDVALGDSVAGITNFLCLQYLSCIYPSVSTPMHYYIVLCIIPFKENQYNNQSIEEWSGWNGSMGNYKARERTKSVLIWYRKLWEETKGHELNGPWNEGQEPLYDQRISAYSAYWQLPTFRLQCTGLEAFVHAATRIALDNLQNAAELTENSV